MLRPSGVLAVSLAALGCGCASTEASGGDSASQAPCGGQCPAGFECNGSACVSAARGAIWITPGTFWMGCVTAPDGGCFADALPPHWVRLSGYAIDRTEVTAAQYAACVAAGACERTTVEWSGSSDLPSAGNPDRTNYPINFVDQPRAEAYCAYAGGRLCAEAEWEKAARGGCLALGCADDDAACCLERSAPWPWGDNPTDIAQRATVGTGQPKAVGAHPSGASPYGVLDLAGNVEEWTADRYAADTYCRGAEATCTEPCDVCAATAAPALTEDPAGPAAQLPKRVVRGGGFDAGAAGDTGPSLSHEDSVRVDRRNPVLPDKVGSRIGFRCCYTVTP